LENHKKIDLNQVKIITKKIILNQIKTHHFKNVIRIKVKSSIKSFVRQA